MNHKKIVSLGLVISMLFGTNVSALTVGADVLNNSDEISQNELLEKFRSGITEQIKLDNDLSQVKDSDTVRIIVEINCENVISKATEKGLKLTDMDKTEICNLQNQAISAQKKVQDEMNRKNINYQVLEQFTNVINGFSAKTTLAEAKNIEKLQGVKSVSIVNEYERPEPSTSESNEIEENAKAWSSSYHGEGTVVAIIDSGIDATHKDMILSKETKTKLDESKVKAIISAYNLPGEFKTDKVPYGYNYMDENNEIRDLGPGATEHGMHVAGIVGANGDPDNGGVKGTAPECQLLAMKVFGNSPQMRSTFSDILIKAIDDSVELGADVINMSLGAPAGFVDNDDPEQIAINNASSNGVIVTVSSGNDSYYGYMLDPYASNPDYGVIGSPATSKEAFSVASTSRKESDVWTFEYSYENNIVKVPYLASTDIFEILLPSIFDEQPLQIVDCGYGNPSEIPTTVEGKVALMQRGNISFTEKINNAAAKGASLAIIYNNESGGNTLIPIDASETSISYCSIGHEDGMKLLNAQKDNPELTIEFIWELATAIDPFSGVISDFSSWGVTPDLDIKPDITGVGENVISTINDNEYKTMSGTSMAAPNIAGSATILYQMMAENDSFKSLSGISKVTTAKNLLMSTAIPNVDTDSNLYVSPRNQGAGIVNIAAATSTPAIVTDSNTGVSKVNLKEIKNNNAEFNINVQNYSDKDLIYDISGTVQTDLVESGYNIFAFGEETNFNKLRPQAILNGDRMPISFSQNQIKVPANGNKDITVTVDLAYTKLANGMTLNEAFENGTYVEGFVVLNDPKDTNAQLSIPYMGFYGDWNQAPAIDYSRYDKEPSFWYNTYMCSLIGGSSIQLSGLMAQGGYNNGYSGDFIDISPNNDGAGDNVLCSLSYLRNIKHMEVEILDSNGNNLRNLLSKDNLRKHYYSAGTGPYCEFLLDALWDGTIDGKVAEEGTYTYRIKSKIDYDNAEYQYKDFKINIDLTAPTIENIHFDENTYEFTVVAEDNFKGHIQYYRLLTPYNYEDGVVDSYDGHFNLSGLYAAGYTLADCKLGVVDYAWNVKMVDFSEPQGATNGDKQAPVVRFLTPEFYDLLGSNQVTFQGFVTDESKIDKLTINGEPVTNFRWGFYSLPDSIPQYGWMFNYTTTFEDGYNKAYVYAKDAAGNETGFSHRFFVDSTAPVIELNEISSITTKDTVKITGLVSENSPTLKVDVNGNLLYSVDPGWEAYDYYEPASYAINYDYKLSDGENTITVEASDLIGHVTSKTLTINKVESIDVIADNKLAGEDRYYTAAEISRNGWEKSNYAVLANGESYIDALVASPLAASYNAPILLTETDQLTDITGKELQRLGVKTVFIAGGTDVISNAVENKLNGLGIATIRFAGSDRYDTSKLVAMYLDRQQDIDEVYVVGGEAIADAVTVASKAAMDKTPIILVENDQISEDVADWLSYQNLEKATVIGGPDVVSDAVLVALDEITTTDVPTARIYGEDRFATNAAVIDTLFPTFVDSVFVTVSDVFVDALVTAPYAAQKGAPVVIAEDKLSDEQAKVMDKMLSYEVVQVGGKVNSAVVEDMAARLSIEK